MKNIGFVLFACFFVCTTVKAQIEIDAIDVKDMFDLESVEVDFLGAKRLQPYKASTDEKLPPLGKLLFSDKQPQYTQWQKDYRVTQIDYYRDRVVFHFLVISQGSLSSIYFAPNGEHPWYLQDADSDQQFPLLEVRNLRVDEVLYSPLLQEDGYIWAQQNGTPFKTICEVHFAALPEDVKKVHLIEGLGKEHWINHFNAFHIYLKKSKKEKIVINDQDTVIANTSSLTREEAYKIFPVPNNGTLYIQALDDKAVGKVTLQIFDMQGKSILTQNNFMVAKGEAQQLDLPSQIINGMYVLNISGNGSFSYQFNLIRE